MSGHTFGSMLWGFLFFVGVLTSIVLFGLILLSFVVEHRLLYYVNLVVGGLGILVGLYLPGYIVVGTGVGLVGALERLVNPASLFIVLVFGAPGILGGLAIHLARGGPSLVGE